RHPRTRVRRQLRRSLGHDRRNRMKRSKFSEEQVAYALRQADGGTAVGDVCRQLGISEATFYVWRKRYGHLGIHEVRRGRQLEDENAVEAPGRRPDARQAHARGSPPAQKLTPTRRRIRPCLRGGEWSIRATPRRGWAPFIWGKVR